MSRLPLVDARTMEKILYHLGFEKVRQKGSHAFYRHAEAGQLQFLSIQTKTLHVLLLGSF
jgi:predicted RNA binding protein YcfA (HicA-like mRNA interferase family)